MAEKMDESQKEVSSSTTGDESASVSTPLPKDESLNEKQNASGPDSEVAEKPEAVSDQGEYPHGVALAFIVLAITLDTFMIALDQTILGTAIPKITDEFRGLSKVSWYASAYFMTFGGFQTWFGKVYKYFDLKITFLASIFIFELGSLICGVAPNANALIVGRAIAGVGGAGMATGGFTIIAFSAEPKRRPLFTGIVGSSYGLSAVVGPILGGVFSDKVTWRWCFYINLPIGGLTAAIIVIFFSTPKAAKPTVATWKEKFLSMDFVGIILTMCFIVCFFLALEKGGQTDAWDSSIVIGLLVGFVAIAITMIVWEYYQGERAQVPFRLVKQRSVWVSSVYLFFFAGSYFVLLYYLPIYFQSIDNTTPIGSGVRTLPMVITFSIVAVLAGAFVQHTGIVTPTMIAGASIATIGAGLIYSWDLGTPTGKWIGYQILAAFGYISSWLVPLNIAQAYSTPEDMSTVTAIVCLFQSLGGAFGVSASQSAFVNTMIKKLAKTAPHMNPALVVATGATEFRDKFPDDIQSILLAYMEGIKTTYAIATAMVGFSILVAFFSPWKRLHGQTAGGAMV